MAASTAAVRSSVAALLDDAIDGAAVARYTIFVQICMHDEFEGVREDLDTGASQLSSAGAVLLAPAVRDRMNQSCELLDSVGKQIDLDLADARDGVRRRSRLL